MFETPEFGPDGIADARLRAAAALPTGSGQLDAVLSLDLYGLCFEDRLVALELVELSHAAIAAREQHLFAALACGRGDGWGIGHDAHEVSLVLRMSAAVAVSRMTVGQGLVGRFGDTLASSPPVRSPTATGVRWSKKPRSSRLGRRRWWRSGSYPRRRG